MTGNKRTLKHEKLARIYDDEILPIWAHRFGRMALRGLELPPKAMILDVACGTGYPAIEVLRRMDDASRLIAIDSSSAMLDVARKKIAAETAKGALKAKIFFRSESAYPKLSFANDVYDLVLCNLGLHELPSPRTALKDFARVTKPGGKVVCTLPLAGTFGEFYDIYREVLVKHDRHDTLERLEKHLATYPEPEEVERWMKHAGLADTQLEADEFSLLFRSSREFFFAPVIEYGPLHTWKAIAGKGQELQDVFWYIKQAIDAYFGDRAFQVTVKAGCLRGVKSAAPIADDEITGEHAKAPEGESVEGEQEWISVQTGEVELVTDQHPPAEQAVADHQIEGEEETEEEEEEDVPLEAFHSERKPGGPSKKE
jgi:ubiquinone/menaquinone biosynthesis C-methylase UbiE